MVSLKVEVKKKDVTWVVLLVAVLVVGVVYAYGGSNPKVMGHSAGEIEGLEELMIPSDAIMAFDLSTCPEGWTELVAAKGKVIVGLDSDDASFDKRGETGGAKTHTLTIAEMPKHSHSTYITTHGGGGLDWTGDGSHFKRVGTSTGNAGSSDSHNNLQPYISFIYCKKN